MTLLAGLAGAVEVLGASARDNVGAFGEAARGSARIRQAVQSGAFALAGPSG